MIKSRDFHFRPKEKKRKKEQKKKPLISRVCSALQNGGGPCLSLVDHYCVLNLTLTF